MPWYVTPMTWSDGTSVKTQVELRYQAFMFKRSVPTNHIAVSPIVDFDNNPFAAGIKARSLGLSYAPTALQYGKKAALVDTN